MLLSYWSKNARELLWKNGSDFEVVKKVSVLLDEMSKQGRLTKQEYPYFSALILIDQKQRIKPNPLYPTHK